jgi:hypothetical protein
VADLSNHSRGRQVRSIWAGRSNRRDLAEPAGVRAGIGDLADVLRGVIGRKPVVAARPGKWAGRAGLLRRLLRHAVCSGPLLHCRVARVPRNPPQASLFRLVTARGNR